MADLVEVDVFIVLSAEPEKQSLDPDEVQMIKKGDSSGLAGGPDYCIVTLKGGKQLKVKGTETEVRKRVGK
jgi:hypothetical protein